MDAPAEPPIVQLNALWRVEPSLGDSCFKIAFVRVWQDERVSRLAHDHRASGP